MRPRLAHTLFASGVILISSLFAACQPTAGPSPTAGPPQPTPPKAAPTSTLPPLTSQDAAWDKIVEAAKKEGKVTAYSFNWVGDVGLIVEKAFENRYGINLEIITGRGAEFSERIKTERRLKQQVGDMTEGSTLLTNSMKLDGSLAVIADELPAMKEKGVWLVEPAALDPQSKAVLVWRLIVFSPYINTKLVKPEDFPKSWKDFLDPKWSGKMSFTDPNIGPGTNQYMVVFMENKVWDEDYIKALYRQKLLLPTSVPDEFRMLAAGERQLMVRGSDSDVGKLAVEGAPVQAIDVKEGVVLSTGAMAAIAGGPNPNATKVLLNWLLTQEGQTVTGKAQGMKMLRKDVPDFRPKAAQVEFSRPLVETIDNLEKATNLFRQKWFDKLVGR